MPSPRSVAGPKTYQTVELGSNSHFYANKTGLQVVPLSAVFIPKTEMAACFGGFLFVLLYY